MQHARGFIDGCSKRVTLISWEAGHTEQQIGQAFYRQKTILSPYFIWVTKWLVTCLQSNPIGTNFAGFCLNLKQFYWYKRRGLLFKLRRPLAFQLSRRLFTGCILIGWLHVTQWGRGIPPFHGNQNPSPGCLPAPAPAAPQAHPLQQAGIPPLLALLSLPRVPAALPMTVTKLKSGERGLLRWPSGVYDSTIKWLVEVCDIVEK